MHHAGVGHLKQQVVCQLPPSRGGASSPEPSQRPPALLKLPGQQEGGGGARRRHGHRTGIYTRQVRNSQNPSSPVLLSPSSIDSPRKSESLSSPDPSPSPPSSPPPPPAPPLSKHSVPPSRSLRLPAARFKLLLFLFVLSTCCFLLWSSRLTVFKQRALQTVQQPRRHEGGGGGGGAEETTEEVINQWLQAY
ncbi:hypothetical protein F7725_001212 [Dissostichus mawsoni]|uniref:Uncharacterized protein n=1 Tax=Dissostichus mawsoni TaxID=36200 RepID=A0A7J5ZJT4_DISMA|nr:hypothetical protein F7725_001212 [Dissostichus mawsoni]